MIIAVDGPSAAGKGTLARGIARAMGFHFLDTGALYRAVGLMMLRHGKALDDVESAAHFAASLDPGGIRDEDLRTEEVAHAASRISAYPAVRKNLLQFQRDFARRKPGAVLDGRDIGTVIAPEAEVKLFVVASVSARAERRFREMQAQGRAVTLEEIAADLEARDARDRTRAEAPLVAASDAVLLDTSDFTRDQAIAAAITAAEARR